MSRRRLTLAAISVILAGCVQPAPVAPAPQSLRAAGAPRAVVQQAAAVLVSDGFEVTTSDAASGILTAKRVRATGGNADYIVCRFAHNSILDTHHRSTMTLSITARPLGTDSSAVIIGGTVLSEYPDLTGMFAKAPNETDCASRGAEEQKIVGSLGAK